MDTTLLALGIGALGGAVRATVGLAKALSLGRKVNMRYYLLTIAIAAAIGSAAGLIFEYQPATALLAGYSGTDVLEGVYKSFKLQKVLMR